MSPFDCRVLTYFLAWCDCSLKLLDLSGCGLSSQSLEIMHRVNLEHHGTTQIEDVNLNNNNPEILTKLSLLPNFEHTKVLKVNCLQYPEGVSSDQVELHCLLNLKHLTVLKNEISELQVLQYWKGNTDSQNAVDIFRSLQHNTCYGTAPTLETLILTY